MRWGRGGRYGCVLLLACGQAGAAHAAASCGPDERWHEGMAMCMPAAEQSSAPPSNALSYSQMTRRDGCGAGMYYQFGMAMCLPAPRQAGSFFAMLMGNAFAVDSGGQGPRSRRALAAPHWLMGNLGIDLASTSRIDLDVMLTAERWTLPAGGYPELLQIGEEDAVGRPYVDAQHPHSSPLMGLAITDVTALGAHHEAILRVWFAPRGETTDGPVAFMHRATGTIDPDAPLGHHIGQDVGHVTSTVLGASLLWRDYAVEASAFHGREPSPTRVDLPLGSPDSWAVRAIVFPAFNLAAAASVARVADPEGDAAALRLWRLSGSLYGHHALPQGWWADTALIWGGITNYDGVAFLQSIAAEAAFRDATDAVWSRLEVLQRSPGELQVAAAAPNVGRWVGSLTLGYTRRIASAGPVDFSLGGMGTLAILPGAFAAAYGGHAVGTARAFLEVRFMQMFTGAIPTATRG